jgi:dsDNA-specific endonuclease/ATPase MutS2
VRPSPSRVGAIRRAGSKSYKSLLKKRARMLEKEVSELDKLSLKLHKKSNVQVDRYRSAKKLGDEELSQKLPDAILSVTSTHVKVSQVLMEKVRRLDRLNAQIARWEGSPLHWRPLLSFMEDPFIKELIASTDQG